MQIHYDPTNKPFRVQRGSHQTEFWYGTDDQRYFQRDNNAGDTIYIDKLFEQKSNGQKKYYLGNYAVLTADLSAGDSISYLHTDRLGSIIAISDEDGDNVQGSGRGFDPFGKPREEDWNDVPPVGGDDLNGYTTTSRGFTGHEHLNGTDLIHMNGRAYDYNLGRFLSVDPVIQFPANSQSLNPYSYIMNNPMAGTDPTGYTCDDPSDTGCNRLEGEEPTDRQGSGPDEQNSNGQNSQPTSNTGIRPNELKKPDQRKPDSDQRDDQEKEKPKALERISALIPIVFPAPIFGAGDRFVGAIKDARKLLVLTPATAGVLGAFYSQNLGCSDTTAACGFNPPPLTDLRQPTLNENSDIKADAPGKPKESDGFKEPKRPTNTKDGKLKKPKWTWKRLGRCRW